MSPSPQIFRPSQQPSADEEVLRKILFEAGNLVFTDPSAARRMLVPYGELLQQLTLSDAALEASAWQMIGNVANQELDFAVAEQQLQAALARAKSAGLHRLQVEISADLLGTLLNLDQVAEAAELLDTTLERVKDLHQDLRWLLLTRQGFLHLRLGESGEALTCFAEAQKLAPALQVQQTPARYAFYASLLEAGLAKLYISGQEPKRGVAAYKEVVGICERFNLRTRLTYHYLELGRAQMLVEDVAPAKKNFQLAIQNAGEQDRRARAAALANLGYYSSQAKNWTEAKAYFDEAEHHFRASGAAVNADLSMVYLWRAEMAEVQGDEAQVAHLLAESFDLASEGNDRAHQALVCLRLANFYADRHAFDKAYEFRLVYEDIQKEVDAERSTRRLGELELRHELEQRRQEGELLKLRATRLQLKALRAQMNPHFIFNALNAIQEFITSQRSTEAATHLAHFARLMRQSLEYSERESISLEEEVDFLRQYLELNLALRYNQSFQFSVTVAEALEDDLILLPAMLVQPYVENALEHGIRLVENGRIEVLFTASEQDEDMLVITILDNGIGRSAAAQHAKHRSSTHKSMGIDITRHRLELLNKEGASTSVQYYDLVDEAGTCTGTRVQIELPIQWRE